MLPSLSYETDRPPGPLTWSLDEEDEDEEGGSHSLGLCFHERINERGREYVLHPMRNKKTGGDRRGRKGCVCHSFKTHSSLTSSTQFDLQIKENDRLNVACNDGLTFCCSFLLLSLEILWQTDCCQSSVWWSSHSDKQWLRWIPSLETHMSWRLSREVWGDHWLWPDENEADTCAWNSGL